MMAKMGFAPGKALGKDSGTAGAASTATAGAGAGAGAAGAGAALEPIRVSIKDGREGIGLESERKRKLREAAEQLGEQNKKAKVDEGSYRDRIRKEKEEARLERELRGAQKVAERFGAEELGGAEGKVLKAMPVVWRGVVKAREEGERSRKMRHDLEVGLASARLPTYDDGEEDEDDRKALGKDKKRTTYEVVDDLDEEDEELDEFEKLPVEDRLSKVVEYLREEFNYCFWCKFQYPDKELEGCPGLTEQDHD
ncbi:hypothetical protein QBC42DRAFT_270978 [Cladorrhinum samala]|uniref:G-patch domain-containing protein n=1 Tax=Cladorrhinum samala TaxID=585594 RepID=A0AAV9HKD4_9PEZI|nr:hypothetical protein QBC42DRAFT_270978 [Cladorrhinum samala]